MFCHNNKMTVHLAEDAMDCRTLESSVDSGAEYFSKVENEFIPGSCVRLAINA